MAVMPHSCVRPGYDSTPPTAPDIAKKTQPAPKRRRLPHSPVSDGSGAGVEHRDRAAVLRPAGNVVTHPDRSLLAVGHRAHPVARDPGRGKIVAHHFGPT